MAHEEHAELAHDFPAGIGKPATQAFIAAGYNRLEQFTKITEADLLQLHGVGPKALGIVRSALNARGLSFAEPTKQGKQRNRKEDRQN
jgi:hypothetical protein